MATIAIIGASGLVGGKLTEILADKLPQHKLRLFGNQSAGKSVFVFNRKYKIEDTESVANEQIDYAMFMANEQTALNLVPKLAQNGTVCIDNSSAFRLKKGVPLVVPQINGETVGCSKIIANPNCTTIQVAIALSVMKKFLPQSITIATYQAASGAGKDGLADLTEKHGYGKLKCFPHPIFDNLLPQIGELLPDKSTTEEQKLRNETKKILNLPTVSVNSFCVRVPVTEGHGAFVNVKTALPFDLEEVSSLLKEQPNVLLLDDAKNNVYPTPQTLRHTHLVGVGRLSADDTPPDENGKLFGLNMFVVADNLLRGAAYNAYEILKISLRNNGEIK